ncbi:MAG: DUF928 domain-containing protein [Magnetococcales bacterium]|nr:DUF928 domain-containing protein [Magnetococcales bacterium]
MNHPWMAVMVAVATFLGCFSWQPVATAKDKSRGERTALIVYRPPVRGAPSSRVGGGVRGVNQDLPNLEALVPEHTGYTSQPQPSLYWFISKPSRAEMEIILLDDNPLAIDPILATTMTMDRAGFYRLDLAKFNIRLKPGVEYQWSVTIMGDPEHPSGDIVSGGGVKYVEKSQMLQEVLSEAHKREHGIIFAREGYWYDAITELSEKILVNPDSRKFRKLRAQLLEQAGLTQAAAAELIKYRQLEKISKHRRPESQRRIIQAKDIHP